MDCLFDDIKQLMDKFVSLYNKRANTANKTEKIAITKEMTLLKDEIFDIINKQKDVIEKNSDIDVATKTDAIKSLDIFKQALNERSYPLNKETLEEYSDYVVLESNNHKNYYQNKLASIKGNKLYMILLFTDIDGNKITSIKKEPIEIKTKDDIARAIKKDIELTNDEVEMVENSIIRHSFSSLDNSEINKVLKDIYNKDINLVKLYKPKDDDRFGLFDFEYKPISNLVDKLVKNDKTFDDSFNKFIEYLPQGIKESIKNDSKAKEHFIGSLRLFHFLKTPTDDRYANAQTKFDGIKFYTDTVYKPNYLIHFGSIEKDKNEVRFKLYPQIEEIIKWHTLISLSNINKIIKINKGKDVDELAQDFGISPNEAIKLKELFENNLINTSSFTSEVAKNVWRDIGIKINTKDVDNKVKDGIIATIESYIEGTLLESSFATYENIENLDGYEFGGKRYKFFKPNFEKIANIFTAGKVKEAKSQEDKDIVISDAINNFSTIINRMQYVSLSHQRMSPSYNPISLIPKYIKKTKPYETNEFAKKYIESQQKIKWYFKEDIGEFIKEYEEHYLNDDTKYKWLKQFGYTMFDEDKHNIKDIDIIESTNERVDRIVNTIYQYAKDKRFMNGGMYLPFIQFANNRVAPETDLNPVEDKLVRRYIEQKGHKVNITKDDFRTNSNNLKMMYNALSQAFDLDPDKNSYRTVKKKVVENVVNIDGDGIIFADTEMGQLAKKYIEEYDKLSLDEKVKIRRYFLDNGEGHHSQQALDWLLRLYKWKKDGMKGTFNNDLTVETDAVTSGVILTLLQLGDDKLIEKGGIYTEDNIEKIIDYTKTLLAIKYMKEDGILYELNKKSQQEVNSIINKYKNDVMFSHSAYIEAGDFHESIRDDVHLLALAYMISNIKFIDTKGIKPFMDIYKTIGYAMLDDVEKRRKQLINKDELSTNERMQLALLNYIGELDGKTLRKIAKPAVMVFVYGATLGSILGKLAFEVGVKNFQNSADYLYKLIKDNIEKYAGETYEEKLINAVISDGKIANGIDMNKYSLYDYITSDTDFIGEIFKNLYKYKNNKLTKMQYSKLKEDLEIVRQRFKLTNEQFKKYKKAIEVMLVAKHFKPSSNFVDMMNKRVVMPTFGSAIKKAFDDIFGDVTKARETIKGIELFINDINRGFFDIIRDKIIKEQGYVSQEQEDKILLDLINENLSNDVNQRDVKVPLIKYDKTKGDQASIVINVKDKDKLHALTNLIEQKFLVHNTGAAPTTTIHSIDSQIIIKTIDKKPLLSIYDAIVQASSYDNVNAISGKYNIETIKQSRNINNIAEYIRKLNDMIDKLSDSSIFSKYDIKPEDIKRKLIEYNKRYKKTKINDVETYDIDGKLLVGSDEKLKVEKHTFKDDYNREAYIVKDKDNNIIRATLFTIKGKDIIANDVIKTNNGYVGLINFTGNKTNNKKYKEFNGSDYFTNKLKNKDGYYGYKKIDEKLFNKEIAIINNLISANSKEKDAYTFNFENQFLIESKRLKHNMFSFINMINNITNFIEKKDKLFSKTLYSNHSGLSVNKPVKIDGVKINNMIEPNIKWLKAFSNYINKINISDFVSKYIKSDLLNDSIRNTQTYTDLVRIYNDGLLTKDMQFVISDKSKPDAMYSELEKDMLVVSSNDDLNNYLIYTSNRSPEYELEMLKNASNSILVLRTDDLDFVKSLSGAYEVSKIDNNLYMIKYNKDKDNTKEC